MQPMYSNLGHLSYKSTSSVTVKKNQNSSYTYLLTSTGWLCLISLLLSCNKEDLPLPLEGPARVNKIVWTANDYQHYTYLPDGKISRYVFQWVYINDGSNATRQVIADFTYHTTGSLDQVIFNSGFFNKYYYEGTVLKKMEEYDNKNRLRLTHHYTFNNQGQLKESVSQVHDLVEGEANQIQQIYSYNSRGNLTEHKMYNKPEGQPAFALSAITKYEAYDDKKSVDNLTIVFPYLPGTKFYENNPGKQTMFGPDATTIISAQSYTYFYNDKGYPVQKSAYVQPAPPADPLPALYEYE